MKTIKLLSLLGIIILKANAYTTINLNASNYSCNKVKINSNTTESVIQNNCKNYKVKYSQDIVGGNQGVNSYNNQPVDPVDEATSDDDVTNLARVRFTTDQGVKMECFYKNSKLYKCKVAKQNTTTASSVK